MQIKSNIYDYKDYKVYLETAIEQYPSGSRGVKKRLADSIKCQVSHISNIFTGDGHLSSEQAEGVARFLGLSTDETEYFLLLIHENRASTSSLKATYSRMLKNIRTKNDKLKNSLKTADSLAPEKEAIYYSEWYYSAIHVLISLKEFQFREEISKRLKLNQSLVDKALEFLVSAGLAKKDGQRFIQNQTQMHLDRDSLFINRHHANWRIHSLQSLADRNTENLRYSGTITLSKDDFTKIRSLLIDSLENSFDVVKKSKDETAAVLNLDFYEL